MDLINQPEVKDLESKFEKAPIPKQIQFFLDLSKQFFSEITSINRHQDQLADKIISIYGVRMEQLGDREYLMQLSQEERNQCFNESIEIRLAIESLKSKDDARKSKEKKDIEKLIIIGFGAVSVATLPKIIKEIGILLVNIKKA
jgi:hypothetical protein